VILASSFALFDDFGNTLSGGGRIRLGFRGRQRLPFWGLLAAGSVNPDGWCLLAAGSVKRDGQASGLLVRWDSGLKYADAAELITS
jgi:hypothetical protein